jgi:hypothetical protein
MVLAAMDIAPLSVSISKITSKVSPASLVEGVVKVAETLRLEATPVKQLADSFSFGLARPCRSNYPIKFKLASRRSDLVCSRLAADVGKILQ